MWVNSLRRIGKFSPLSRWLLSLALLSVLCSTTSGPLLAQVPESLVSSLAGSTPNPYLEGTSLQTPPEPQPIAVPPSATALQEAVIRLKNWDQFWTKEKAWRLQVTQWSNQMVISSIESNKRAQKALDDKEAERAAWEQSYNALLAQFKNVGTDKALIGTGGFFAGFFSGFGVKSLFK